MTNQRFAIELTDGLAAGAFGRRTGGAGSADGEGDRVLLPLALPLLAPTLGAVVVGGVR